MDTSAFGRVGVLMGGRSAEREVSLMSGQKILAALQTAGIDAVGIDVGDAVIESLQQAKLDRVFIALHGPEGEDGAIQGLLDWMGLPYTGSGVLASAIAMDKVRTKTIWHAAGLPTPAFKLWPKDVSAENIAEGLRFPLAVKPIVEGSSVGVSKVNALAELPAAYAKAEPYGAVMVEEWIEGPELTVSIIGDRRLPSVKIVPAETFYDYQAKYFVPTTRYDCPSGLSAEAEAQLLDLAWQAYECLDCRHWGRVDAMQDADGNFWLLEMNTIPGMTEKSLLPVAAAEIGWSFQAAVVKILEQTL